MALGLATTNGGDGGEDDNRRKAEVFFQRGRSVADAGQFDYAVELFLQGLAIIPAHVSGHQELRVISFQRKAAGGRSLKTSQILSMSARAHDNKQAMLNAEMLLAYDPGNAEHMLALAEAAARAEYVYVVEWITPILRMAQRGISGANELE